MNDLIQTNRRSLKLTDFLAAAEAGSTNNLLSEMIAELPREDRPRAGKLLNSLIPRKAKKNAGIWRDPHSGSLAKRNSTGKEILDPPRWPDEPVLPVDQRKPFDPLHNPFEISPCTW